MEHYKFFQHKECEFYPCHKIDNINCKLCFCPLYLIDCDGIYKELPNGMKDCSECLLPHLEDGWNKIINKLNTTLFGGK